MSGYAIELREAADKLWGLAEGATPGPWFRHHLDSNVIRGNEGRNHVAEVGGSIPWPTNADLITTMHPGVAAALADWLDERAKDYVGKADECLRVARLINGGAAYGLANTDPAQVAWIDRPDEERRYIGGCAGFICHERCPGGGVCCCREEDRPSRTGEEWHGPLFH